MRSRPLAALPSLAIINLNLERRGRLRDALVADRKRRSIVVAIRSHNANRVQRIRLGSQLKGGAQTRASDMLAS